MMLWVVPWSFSTPSMVTVWLPAPLIRAPMELSSAARLCTSGSAAAFTMAVVPLAVAAASIRFCVPSTLG